MIKLWTLQLFIIGHAHIHAYILGKIYYEIRFLLSTYDQNIIQFIINVCLRFLKWESDQVFCHAILAE